jgi:hypothetical protein
MKYRTHRAFPVGGVMVPGETTIDTADPAYAFLIGVVPPPDVSPQDQECRDVLTREYSPQGSGPGKLRI